jgi:hypothetical protein
MSALVMSSFAFAPCFTARLSIQVMISSGVILSKSGVLSAGDIARSSQANQL